MIIKPVPVPCNDTPGSPQLPGALSSDLAEGVALALQQMGKFDLSAGWQGAADAAVVGLGDGPGRERRARR
jgi:hypothetical protein